MTDEVIVEPKKRITKPKAEIVVAQPQSTTPMELLRMAVSANADVDKLKQLLELQFAWEANQARKAFVDAMNAFKANPPKILKNKHVHYEVAGKPSTDYDHATLDHVCKVTTESLSKHGISHRWTVAQDNGLIRVTCILTHFMGHSEETTLCAGPDATGSKNAIQAIASAVTYLERYSLLAATGQAAANTDNDGQGAAAWDMLDEYVGRIMNAGNLKQLEEIFKAAYAGARERKDTEAMKALILAKDVRKEALNRETAS
jgi:hypothetical protein